RGLPRDPPRRGGRRPAPVGRRGQGAGTRHAGPGTLPAAPGGDAGPRRGRGFGRMTTGARALVFEGAGRPLRVRTFPLPRLAPGESRVRVRACTLCGSDLHTYSGRRAAPCPLVLGHEAVGTVEALAPGRPSADWRGQPLRVGDRVVWSLAVGCGRCF